ncbi:hypothetical protein DDV96_15765 [Marixanthomonas spongiae]|uniref:Uncharacterized protein n=2 Tax=Marixanthomonas spongiae TaxID=2174845 RepID=A0A2U0HRB3_9FLAO|nr:hypothetical protein DDV96_15765 [Marixanthomonas spongiae]
MLNPKIIANLQATSHIQTRCVQAKKMKSVIKILTIVLLIGIYNCEFKNDRQEYAEMLIEKVEKFKKTNNRLPKDVTELGLNEKIDSPAFYEMETDSTYIVWYGLSVGVSKVFKSSTKKWPEEG